MTDGLLSIKDKKKQDPNSELYMESHKHKKLNKFNPYKYASPNLTDSQVINYVLKINYLLT
jgi:hypothetical protein